MSETQPEHDVDDDAYERAIREWEAEALRTRRLTQRVTRYYRGFRLTGCRDLGEERQLAEVIDEVLAHPAGDRLERVHFWKGFVSMQWRGPVPRELRGSIGRCPVGPFEDVDPATI